MKRLQKSVQQRLARGQVWRSERAAPVAASLEQLFAEPTLLPTLAACLTAREPAEASKLLGARLHGQPPVILAQDMERMAVWQERKPKACQLFF